MRNTNGWAGLCQRVIGYRLDASNVAGLGWIGALTDLCLCATLAGKDIHPLATARQLGLLIRLSDRRTGQDNPLMVRSWLRHLSKLIERHALLVLLRSVHRVTVLALGVKSRWQLAHLELDLLVQLRGLKVRKEAPLRDAQVRQVMRDQLSLVHFWLAEVDAREEL